MGRDLAYEFAADGRPELVDVIDTYHKGIGATDDTYFIVSF
jgi:hypothetical protein